VTDRTSENGPERNPERPAVAAGFRVARLAGGDEADQGTGGGPDERARNHSVALRFFDSDFAYFGAHEHKAPVDHSGLAVADEIGIGDSDQVATMPSARNNADGCSGDQSLDRPPVVALRL